MMIKSTIIVLCAALLLSTALTMPAEAEMPLKEKLHSQQWLENGKLHYERHEYRKAMECFERALMIDRHNIDAETMLNKVLEEVLEQVKKEQQAVVAKPINENADLEQQQSIAEIVAQKKASTKHVYVKSRPTIESELRKLRESNLRAGLAGKTEFKLLKGYLKKTTAKEKAQLTPQASLNTGNVEYHNKLGVKYAKAGQFELAIEEFHNVLTVDPGNMFARMNLALCYAYSDKLYEAIKEYKKVIQLAPEGSKYSSKAQTMLVKIKDLI